MQLQHQNFTESDNFFRIQKEFQQFHKSFSLHPSAHSEILSQEVLQLCQLWQYRLWSFQAGKGFCIRINKSTWKLLNFEFWINGEI
jgi:hypothetical protein